jgi:phage tail protein X
MSSLLVSRRRMMALLGGSLAVAPAIAHANPGLARTGFRSQQPRHHATALLAPLATGSRLASWWVEGISEVRHGAITVALRDSDGVFYLDICRRDRRASAPSAPARSEHYEVFVANLGDGSLPTRESQGLAAMVLAEVIRANEQTVRVPDMLTLAERLERHSGEVLREL